MALTRGFAARLGPRGIRVNAVCPGLVMTGMSDGWDPAVIERATQRTPLGRLAQPEEIAEAALFLAGEAGRWVHGEVLEVNGGAYFD
jgi:3-oxoacyl-[acyl-carrier protein] reductase